MKHHFLPALAALSVFLSGSGLAADVPTKDQMLKQLVQERERFWKGLQKSPPSPTLSSRALFEYALALCEARVFPERLEKLFALADQMQDKDKESRSYGNFRWSWGHEKVLDYNAVDFSMQCACLMWSKHREWIPQPARQQLKQLVDLGIEGCLRHRVATSYTNIAMMNAQDLIILGEATGRKDAADEGYQRLSRQIIYVWENGIHEYDSPTYYGVDLDALGLIEALAQREIGRQQARALLELMWNDIACNWFPAAQKLAGTRSRDYDYLRGLGYADHWLWLAGWLPATAPAVPKSVPVYMMYSKYRPSASLRELNEKKFPRLVRQVWGEDEPQFKTHYVCSDVTLGTSGATYWNMDIPLSVDFAGPRDGVRCYFISDGRHDPYGKIKIPEGKTGAHEKTLHLKPFFAAVQRRVDAAAVVAYQDKEIPEGTQTLESHFVMPQQADGFWVGQKQVDLSKPARILVNKGEAVFLKRGSAVVGIKVAWARSCDGSDAPAALEFDGNTFGAVRLTIDHHITPGAPPKVTPAAALVVRIGSQISNQAALGAWCKSFVAASVTCEGTDKGIDLRAQGEDGPVRVQAYAPFNGWPKLEPAPSRVLLELDGQDIGRKILENVEPVRSYRLAQRELKPVAIGTRAGTYFEAETAACVDPIEVADDAGASGGKFIWMPGEPGSRGGSPTGSATWRLQVEQPGTYYLWGRVISPTPDNDSFYAKAMARGVDALPQTTWALGVHKQWTWVPLAQGKEPIGLTLPEGETRLQLRVREQGAKMDRLYISSKKNDLPK